MNDCHFKYLKDCSQPEIYGPNDVVIIVSLFRRVQLLDILMAISTLIGNAIKMWSHVSNMRYENDKGYNKSKHATWQSVILPLRYSSIISHFCGNAVGKQYCYDLEDSEISLFLQNRLKSCNWIH